MVRSMPQQPQYFAQLAHDFPRLPAHFIARIGLGLIGCARRQSRLAVGLCNGDIDQDAYDRRAENVRKLIDVLIRELKGDGPQVKYITGGDPRGAALKLVLPSGIKNDFCGEGYCVPEGK